MKMTLNVYSQSQELGDTFKHVMCEQMRDGVISLKISSIVKLDIIKLVFLCETTKKLLDASTQIKGVSF